MDPTVQTFDITKRFGNFNAVDHVNLVVESEIFGLLGPNGAGKTTLARMLTTVLTPTEGTARVAGVDILRDSGKVRERIGVVTQAMTLDVELTARENMDYYGQYHGMPRQLRQERTKELLEVVGLADRADQLVSSFSGGMKRRLEIVRSLIHEPKILFLDEPTTGLDPQGRAAIWEHLVHIHRDEGITLVITTHYMDEAEGLCDRLAIVDHGKVVALGTPRELKQKISGGDIVEADFSNLPESALKALQASDFVLEIKRRDGGLTILVKNGAEAVPRIVGLVDAKGGKIRTITLRELTLDDVFLQVTGRSLRE
ncbi:MAG: ATP-binding cassette domain-containing protein [Candidatus Bathyarchaeia archaeon]|jgi:ABC-2 type transport system ATP-binding protein